MNRRDLRYPHVRDVNPALEYLAWKAARAKINKRSHEPHEHGRVAVDGALRNHSAGWTSRGYRCRFASDNCQQALDPFTRQRGAVPQDKCEPAPHLGREQFCEQVARKRCASPIARAARQPLAAQIRAGQATLAQLRRGRRAGLSRQCAPADARVAAHGAIEQVHILEHLATPFAQEPRQAHHHDEQHSLTKIDTLSQLRHSGDSSDFNVHVLACTFRKMVWESAHL